MPVTGDGVGVKLVGRVETPFWDIHGGPPDGASLPADQVADAIVWALSQPPGVDINTLTIRPAGSPARHRMQDGGGPQAAAVAGGGQAPEVTSRVSSSLAAGTPAGAPDGAAAAGRSGVRSRARP
jgi:hypothetical protein